MTVNQADLLITHGLIVTCDPSGKIIDYGFVAVRDGRLIAVESGEPQDWTADRVIDAKGGLVLPGLINAHTHLPMTLFRGLADDLPLEPWLNEHIFPAEAKLNAELVAVGAELACAELIRGGVTTACDMYLWADQVAGAVDRSGLRGCLGEVLYDFPSPHYGDIDSGFDFTADLIDHYKDHPRISILVMPHALYTCSPDLLRRAWDLAADRGVDVHTHLSETVVENRSVEEAYGRRPVDHLDDLGLLTGNLLGAHMVHLTDGEIDLLAQRGVRAAHCPESNMKLASGVARLGRMTAAGMTVGLGSDGTASNNDLSILGEMRSCALIHKVDRMDPTAAPAEEVLALATRRGAAAVGLGDLIGSLEPGKEADLIIVDSDAPHLQPVYNPVSHLIYAALPSDVTHTIVRGRVLMADRELQTIDWPAIRARVGEAAAKIKN